jgi:hypothetical protein
MNKIPIITTSWDDGHPLDERLAELLCKYGIQGTFYIPQINAEHEVMNAGQIVSLSQNFEIGGHTIQHVRINNSSDELFEKEILGSYTWLTHILGQPPISFCFPGGKYTTKAIDFCREIGFEVVRSTELLNLNNESDFGLMPTTIQLYPHSRFTYVKHLCKRFKFSSLIQYIELGSKKDLNKLIDVYVNELIQNGGCLHLWGHSWEIEQFELWTLLDEILKQLSGIQEVKYLPNKEVRKYTN